MENRSDRDKFVAVHNMASNPLQGGFPCPSNLCKLANIPYDFGSLFQSGAGAVQPKQTSDQYFASSIGQKSFGPCFYDVKTLDDAFCKSALSCVT